MDKSSHKAALPAENGKSSRRTNLRRLLVLSAIIVAAVLLPLQVAGIIPRACPWYNITGLECPFCGLVRSVIAAGHGSFRVSAALHPFGTPVLAGIIAAALLFALRLARGRQIISVPRWLTAILWAAIGAVWLSWWILARLSG